MIFNYFSAPNTLVAKDRFFRKLEDKRDGRTDFAIDRDRILYSKSFRRLSDKTQVFLSNDTKDLRTRLTHTLEVNQIAKTIITSLGCNLDLSEAIALGHDVGHTPFGHVGERTLNLIMNGCEQVGIKIADSNTGFKHNLQSARVLCELEGLNLSKYTIWGIINHSKLKYKPCKLKKNICYTVHHPQQCLKTEGKKLLACTIYDSIITAIEDNKYWSIEGLVVAMADEIAQRHHDIEDSLRFCIIDRNTLLAKLDIFEPVFTELDKELLAVLRTLKDAPLEDFLAQFSRLIVKSYVVNLTEETKKRLKVFGETYHIASKDDFYEKKNEIEFDEARMLVGFSEEFQAVDTEFQKFLMNEVLNSHRAQSMDGKGAYIIRRLFDAYLSNPIQLPDHVFTQFYKSIGENAMTIGEMRGKINEYRNTDRRRNYLMRAVADYIGSLTDSSAYSQFNGLYGTMK